MKIIADFMKCPDVEQLFSTLEGVGGKGCVRFVGGCIRNALLGIAVNDIDMATSLLPDEVEAALSAQNVKTIPVGKAHGTIGAIINSRLYEITTLRLDAKTDGRHAEVAFTSDWNQDALRRDFTINALSADIDGTVYDPTGQGLADIETRTVRFIGDPKARIAEDYLRILRFYRFSAQLSVNIDFESSAACGEMKNGLLRLSAERVWQEIQKILTADDPSEVTLIMWQQGLLGVLMPMVSAEAFNKAIFRTACILSDESLLRFAALLRSMGVNDKLEIVKISAHLRLSKTQAKRIALALGLYNLVQTLQINIDKKPKNSDVIQVKKWLYEYGNQALMDAILLEAATTKYRRALNEWLGVAQQAKPLFKLKGRDLIKRGFAPGPKIKALLSQIELQWIESGFNDEEIDQGLMRISQKSETRSV
jgi:poly(A) polymerase